MDLYYSPQADYDNGQVLWGSWDNEYDSTEQYWKTLITQAGNRSMVDPYGFIDGGYEMPGSYQFITAKPWKGTVLAAHLMPSLRPVINNEDLFEYVERWVDVGTWSQPDFAAPADGIVSGGVKDGQTVTMTGDPGEGGTLKLSMNNYGITFGDNKDDPGYFIPDTNPTDGMGRLPDGHNISADEGHYGHPFIDNMWNNYRDSVLSISKQPRSKKIPLGNDVTFSVAASGNPTYQWLFNGATLPGETSENLTIGNADKSNEGSYSVVLTNSTGSVTSQTAVLEVIGQIPAVQAPELSTAGNKNTITWENSGDAWDNIVIVRKTGSEPDNPYDGLIVYNGTGNVFEDSTTADDNYYNIYTRKAFDTNIVYSQPVAVTDEIKQPGALVPSVVVEPGLTVEVGEEVFFSAEDSTYEGGLLAPSDLVRYEWDFGDGYNMRPVPMQDGNTNNGYGGLATIHYFMTPGTFEVKLTISRFNTVEDAKNGNIKEPVEMAETSIFINVTGEAPMEGFEVLRAPFNARIAQFITVVIPETVASVSTNRLVVTLEGKEPASTVTLVDKTIESTEEKYKLETGKLIANEYRLVTRLLDANSEQISIWVDKFTKTYDGIPKVGINEWNAICKDGEPYFPVNMYWLYPNQFDLFDDCGTAIYTMQGANKATVQQWEEYAAQTKAKGWDIIGPGDVPTSKGRNGSLSVREDYVNATKDNDEMLMWAWQDEPNLNASTRTYSEISPTVLAAWTYATNQLDSKHPVTINMYGYDWLPFYDTVGTGTRWYTYNVSQEIFGGKRAFYTDILDMDIYPLEAKTHASLFNKPENGPVALWVQAIDNFIDRDFDLIPHGIFVQTCDGRDNASVGPTHKQVLMQAWLAVTHGAKQINWFPYHVQSTRLFSAMKEFTTSMETYGEIIVGPGNVEQITDNSNVRTNRVDTLTREGEDGTYLFAVRLTEPEPLTEGEFIETNHMKPENLEPDVITTTFTVPRINDGCAYVMDIYGEIKSYIPIRNGEFTDTFEKEDYRIYRISDGDPNVSLESIAITTLPLKTTYNVGEALDLEGLVVTGTYNDDSTAVLENSMLNISGFNSSAAEEDQVVTVKYEEKTATFTVNIVGTEEYAFVIENVSLSTEAGIVAQATVAPNTAEGGNVMVIFKLMKDDGTVIGLTSSELNIEDSSVFRMKFHGYSGDEYKVKIFVWDKLDGSTDNIGVNLAEPVEAQ